MSSRGTWDGQPEDTGGPSHDVPAGESLQDWVIGTEGGHNWAPDPEWYHPEQLQTVGDLERKWWQDQIQLREMIPAVEPETLLISATIAVSDSSEPKTESEHATAAETASTPDTGTPRQESSDRHTSEEVHPEPNLNLDTTPVYGAESDAEAQTIEEVESAPEPEGETRVPEEPKIEPQIDPEPEPEIEMEVHETGNAAIGPESEVTHLPEQTPDPASSEASESLSQVESPPDAMADEGDLESEAKPSFTSKLQSVFRKKPNQDSVVSEEESSEDEPDPYRPRFAVAPTWTRAAAVLLWLTAGTCVLFAAVAVALAVSSPGQISIPTLGTLPAMMLWIIVLVLAGLAVLGILAGQGIARGYRTWYLVGGGVAIFTIWIPVLSVPLLLTLVQRDTRDWVI